MRISDASQLIVHAATSCCCWGFTFVTVVLAVNAIAGADYSAFVIFIPQFVIAGVLLCCMVCFICCVRDLPDMGELWKYPGSQREESALLGIRTQD